MKEVLETIIKNLVDNKDAVEIKEVENEKSIVFEVKVADEDYGKSNWKTRKNSSIYQNSNESSCWQKRQKSKC